MDLKLIKYNIDKDVLRLTSPLLEHAEQERASFSINRSDLLAAHIKFSCVNSEISFGSKLMF